jgi:hypothetical protein
MCPTGAKRGGGPFFLTNLVLPKCQHPVRYAVAVSDGDFDQTSFVNNVRTNNGGTHVQAVQRPVVRAITDHFTKHPSINASAAAVRRQTRVFVNALIVNPSFGSQVRMVRVLFRVCLRRSLLDLQTWPSPLPVFSCNISTLMLTKPVSLDVWALCRSRMR